MDKQFKLSRVRERLATCEKYSHLPELESARQFCRKILKEVDGVNYETLYRAAAHSVTKRDTEIDRLQRAIYNLLPHDEAEAIIDAAPLPLQRTVIRDKQMVNLKQGLDAARAVRDNLITQKQNEFVVDWAYRIVSAQGSVDQAKKALYMYLRKTAKSRYSDQDNKHRDL